MNLYMNKHEYYVMAQINIILVLFNHQKIFSGSLAGEKGMGWSTQRTKIKQKPNQPTLPTKNILSSTDVLYNLRGDKEFLEQTEVKIVHQFILSHVFMLLISILLFQLKKLPLIFLIRLFYWWWTLSFCLSGKLLPFSSILKDNFAT